MEQADFEWGDKGEAFWRELAESCRQRCGVKATDLQLKFFVAHQTRKVTNAYAAQLAGAQGRTANAGYRLKRSEAYQQLEREIALDGVETKYCDASRRKVILSELAETGSPQDRLRACQSLEAIEANEREFARETETIPHPKNIAERIAQISPLLALWLSRCHKLNCGLSPVYRPTALIELEEVRRWITQDDVDFTIEPSAAELQEHARNGSNRQWDPKRVPWKEADTASEPADAQAVDPIEANGNGAAKPVA